MSDNLNSCPQCGSALRVLASVDHSDLRIVRVICQNQECESLWWVTFLGGLPYFRALDRQVTNLPTPKVE